MYFRYLLYRQYFQKSLTKKRREKRNGSGAEVPNLKDYSNDIIRAGRNRLSPENQEKDSDPDGTGAMRIPLHPHFPFPGQNHKR